MCRKKVKKIIKGRKLKWHYNTDGYKVIATVKSVKGHVRPDTKPEILLKSAAAILPGSAVFSTMIFSGDSNAADGGTYPSVRSFRSKLS